LLLQVDDNYFCRSIAALTACARRSVKDPRFKKRPGAPIASPDVHGWHSTGRGRLLALLAALDCRRL